MSSKESPVTTFAVLGSGNIVTIWPCELTFQGASIARGIVYAKVSETKNVILTRYVVGNSD